MGFIGRQRYKYWSRMESISESLTSAESFGLKTVERWTANAAAFSRVSSSDRRETLLWFLIAFHGLLQGIMTNNCGWLLLLFISESFIFVFHKQPYQIFGPTTYHCFMKWRGCCQTLCSQRFSLISFPLTIVEIVEMIFLILISAVLIHAVTYIRLVV